MVRSLSIIGLFILLSMPYCASCQTPANDLNWQLDTAKSDEFNTSVINTSKWRVLDCPSGDCCNWGGGTALEKGNTTDSAGILRLRTDGPGFAPIPCNRDAYATGGIQTDSANYSYGYFEISAQLPGFYNSGNPCGKKFEPSFWMAYEQHDTNCLTIHNEIDPIIPNGWQYANADTVLAGWSHQNGNCGAYTVGSGKYGSKTPLFAGFNKYGLEWKENSIVFYFNDLPFSENYNSPTMVMHPLYVYINDGLDDSADHFNLNTPFPQNMLVDYFRYYTLKLDCSANTVILTNADLAAYVYSVKSSITFGNGSSSISLSNTDVKYFRAVNSITINGTFTAPLGSELGLIATPCD